jgi:predicted phosphodiesterase
MSKLTIDVISDTHGMHKNVLCPGGDVLFHCGDVSGRGESTEILRFVSWLEQQPYKYKIFIAGNHDKSLERDRFYWEEECRQRGIILLNDSGTTIEHESAPGGIKIWGSPVSPFFNNWSFNRHRNEEHATDENPWIKPHWDLIPKDTEILLTHGPAYGILDEVVGFGGSSYNPKNLVGCQHLADKIRQSDVKLHLFGHIHEGRGVQYEKNTTHVNASFLDAGYFPATNRPTRVSREVFEDGSVGYVV